MDPPRHLTAADEVVSRVEGIRRDPPAVAGHRRPGSLMVRKLTAPLSKARPVAGGCPLPRRFEGRTVLGIGADTGYGVEIIVAPPQPHRSFSAQGTCKRPPSAPRTQGHRSVRQSRAEVECTRRQATACVPEGGRAMLTALGSTGPTCSPTARSRPTPPHGDGADRGRNHRASPGGAASWRVQPHQAVSARRSGSSSRVETVRTSPPCVAAYVQRRKPYWPNKAFGRGGG